MSLRETKNVNWGDERREAMAWLRSVLPRPPIPLTPIIADAQARFQWFDWLLVCWLGPASQAWGGPKFSCRKFSCPNRFGSIQSRSSGPRIPTAPWELTWVKFIEVLKIVCSSSS